MKETSGQVQALMTFVLACSPIGIFPNSKPSNTLIWWLHTAVSTFCFYEELWWIVPILFPVFSLWCPFSLCCCGRNEARVFFFVCLFCCQNNFSRNKPSNVQWPWRQAGHLLYWTVFIANLIQPRVTREKGSFAKEHIRLAYGSVCGALSWLMTDVGGPRSCAGTAKHTGVEIPARGSLASSF